MSQPAALTLLAPDDVESYRSLWLYGLRESPLAFSDHHDEAAGWSDAIYRQILTPTGSGGALERFTLGGYDDGRLAGIVSFARDSRINARHKGILKALYVHDELRGRGLGAALVEELISRARRLPGLRQVYLWALESRGPSVVPFYEGLGFRCQGPRVAEDLRINGEWVTAHYMTRTLEA